MKIGDKIYPCNTIITDLPYNREKIYHNTHLVIDKTYVVFEIIRIFNPNVFGETLIKKNK